METLICKYCKKEFIPTGAYKQESCSIKCRKRYLYHHRNGDICICKLCGKEFMPKAKDRIHYCSRECNDVDRKNKSIEAQPVKLAAKLAEKIVKQNHRYKYVCIVCDKEFENRIKLKCLCCSRECHRKYAHNKFLESKESEEYKLTLAKMREEYIPKPKVIKICLECGMGFESCRARQYYCSDVCGRKALKRNQRHIRRQRVNRTYEKISLNEVIKRLGLVCGVCDKPINIQLKSPDKYSLTIDHIIPLAKGGTHTYNNIQLAHMICNTIKSDNLVLCN